MRKNAEGKTRQELQREYNRAYMERQRAKYPEKFKAYNLKSDYNLSLEAYNKMLSDQKGCCAVCNRVMEKPCVDHNHETEQVRELLCRECNLALGFVRDDVAIAERLVAYLKKWEQ
jgi:hypothetical protein